MIKCLHFLSTDPLFFISHPLQITQREAKTVDAIKVIVVLTLVISLLTLTVIVVVLEESIRNASIPDAESGVVLSKNIISDHSPATHVVNLLDGRTLYIQNNTALYESILEDQNQIYSFMCRKDFNNNLIIIESVNPQGGLVASKASVTDKPAVNYAVNLANNRTLYIANNATLYNEIMINQTYLFDCPRNDYANNMYLINGAKLVP